MPALPIFYYINDANLTYDQLELTTFTGNGLILCVTEGQENRRDFPKIAYSIISKSLVLYLKYFMIRIDPFKDTFSTPYFSFTGQLSSLSTQSRSNKINQLSVCVTTKINHRTFLNGKYCRHSEGPGKIRVRMIYGRLLSIAYFKNILDWILDLLVKIKPTHICQLGNYGLES